MYEIKRIRANADGLYHILDEEDNFIVLNVSEDDSLDEKFLQNAVKESYEIPYGEEVSPGWELGDNWMESLAVRGDKAVVSLQPVMLIDDEVKRGELTEFVVTIPNHRNVTWKEIVGMIDESQLDDSMLDAEREAREYIAAERDYQMMVARLRG